MSDDLLPPLPGPSGVRAWRRYRPDLGATIIARAELGESMAEICRDPEMPCRDSVRKWSAEHKETFGDPLIAARKRGGHLVRGRKRVWCPYIARLILYRLAEEGLSLTRAVAGEGMPCLVTVYRWIHEREDFARGYAQACTLRGHAKFEQVWEIAEAAEPGTASVARLKIDALKWQAARLAPKRYGAKVVEEAGPRPARRPASEPPGPPPQAIRIRHFDAEEGEAGEAGEPDYEDIVWNPRPPPPEAAPPERWEL